VLEHQYLEHQYRIKWWASALAGVTALIDRTEQFSKGLPLDGPCQFWQGIAEAFKQFEAGLVIKEAGLHGFSEDGSGKVLLSQIWVGF
jgi:hypothetical protein